MTKNTNATRYYSSSHESSVAKLLGAVPTPNSGAGHFSKGDLQQKEASLLIECKTVMTPKKSIAIQKEWIDKNKQEAFLTRFNNSCIAFNFEPNGDSYFVIDEKLMRFLVEKLVEDARIE